MTEEELDTVGELAHTCELLAQSLVCVQLALGDLLERNGAHRDRLLADPNATVLTLVRGDA